MIYLIGTGPMSQDYAKVLNALSVDFKVIGRGSESAKVFENNIGIKPITGGIESFLQNHQLTSKDSIIITTGTESLMSTLKLLVNTDVDRVLIEKPAAVSIDELLENEIHLKPISKKVFIGYNRRFYSSVIEAIKLIENDGGLKSMHFEFTEWSHKIEPLLKAEGVKENWFFANSTHVVDLAFYIGGIPIDWKAYSKEGNITWHNKSIFSGAGITKKNVLFSFISNWESAGRWSIELMTINRRIYLKPLEEIYIQNRGTIELIKHEFDNKLDLEYKPGLYLQTQYFLNDRFKLLGLEEHISNAKNIFKKMI